jgi:uncharacterized membrane protein YccC
MMIDLINTLLGIVASVLGVSTVWFARRSKQAARAEQKVRREYDLLNQAMSLVQGQRDEARKEAAVLVKIDSELAELRKKQQEGRHARKSVPVDRSSLNSTY